MSKTIVTLIVSLSSLALFAGGCAKRDMVKKDEVVPAASPVTPATNRAASATAAAAKAPTLKPENAATNSSASAKVEPLELSGALQKIYFDFDSYTLSEASRNVLAGNAAFLKKSEGKLRIEGNCDERGSDDYNLALGERRAKEAMRYLVTMGVDQGRISVISYGKEKPVDPAHTQEAWKKNRRDEFVLVK